MDYFENAQQINAATVATPNNYISAKCIYRLNNQHTHYGIFNKNTVNAILKGQHVFMKTPV